MTTHTFCTPRQIVNGSFFLTDVRTRPTTYTQIAEAIVAGVCDESDDLEAAVFALADVVDYYTEKHPKPKTPGKMDLTPTWNAVLAGCDLRKLKKNKVLQEQVLHLGKCADHVAELWAKERAVATA